MCSAFDGLYCFVVTRTAAKPHQIFDSGKSALNLMKGGKLCISIFMQKLFLSFLYETDKYSFKLMNRFNLNDVQLFTRFGNQEFNSQKIRKLTHHTYNETSFHQLYSTSKLHISKAQYSSCKQYLNEHRRCNSVRVVAGTLDQPSLICSFQFSFKHVFNPRGCCQRIVG